ncbi:MAG: fluoride efflux transporter CrcB [Rhodospirillales bacterium]
MAALVISVGGAVGTLGRYAVSGAVARAFGETFPWGTLIVNVTGSFLIGLVAVTTGPDGRLMWPSLLRQYVMVGIFGGFTTFSSFSLQTLTLMREGDWLWAGFNVIGSLVLCLVGCWVGWSLGLWINR